MSIGTSRNPVESSRKLRSERDPRRYYRLRRQRYAEMADEGLSTVDVQARADEEAHHHAALAERDAQIEKLAADNASLRELALRSRADLENARKRFQREKAETVKFATENLVRDVVPVLDNLERALGSVGDTPEAQAIGAGIRMVADQLVGILTANGLEVLDPTGRPFDPHFHEAVAAEERDDVPDSHIIDTFQKGYVLRGRVIRPAMVRVARAPRGAAEPAGQSVGENTMTEKKVDKPIPSGEELFSEAESANESPDDNRRSTRANAMDEAMAGRENPDDQEESDEAGRR